MSLPSVSVDQMRPKLLTLDQIQERLGKTEPLEAVHVAPSAGSVKFKLDPDWATDLDAVADTSVVGAAMSINGKEYQLTKQAALQAAANLGLPGPYVKKMPSALIEPHLNYGYSGALTEKEYKALTVKGNIAAFTRPTVEPFSNIQLLDNAVKGLQKLYGKDVEILGDYKFNNTLKRTDVRLILPHRFREITDSGMNDLADGVDLWSAGLHLSNSAIGKTQTSIESYLFRWWCTNGETTSLDEVGTWSRRGEGTPDDVYEWAQHAVDEIFQGMDERFNQIQALTSLTLQGSSLQDVIRQIYSDFDIPVAQRRQITQALADSTIPSTMYGIMNVITEAANEEGMTPEHADRLMRVGGSVPTTIFDTIKAKVWREGHLAEPDASNPYEIITVQ